MAKQRNNSSFRRKSHYRKTRKIILIVVEGEKTEYNYFNALKNNLKLSGVTVDVTPSKNSDPINVVKHAQHLDKQRRKESKKEDKLIYDKVFCVVDGDTDVNNLRTAREQAHKDKFEFILSVPCFEIWFLLHFAYSTKSYNCCKEVIKSLRNKQYWPEYDKVTKDYKIVLEKEKRDPAGICSAARAAPLLAIAGLTMLLN